MWWIHTYQWLEENNLWKATVAWCVGILLNAVWAARLWAKQKRAAAKRHAAVMDRLDTTTPGGLGDLANLIRDVEGPDDNGSDEDDERRMHGFRSSGMPDIHPPMPGGSGAGHH